MVLAPALLPSVKRILVVEDEVLIRMVVADELRDTGFTVIEAAHAEEALAYIKAGEGVDLVFSDIHMPGKLNGVDLARAIREHNPLIPVILTSANRGLIDLDDRVVFVAKPYRIPQVIALMSKTLGLDRPDGAR